MPILLHSQILKAQKNGKIHIYPFIKENIGTNSVDVRLDSIIKTYIPLYKKEINGEIYFEADRNFLKRNPNFFIDPSKENRVYETEIPENGAIFSPDILYLGSIIEEAGSEHYIPMYDGRSSMARLGIQSHISAGFGDVGFKARWTLEIIVTQKTKLFPNMRIGQVYFVKTKNKELKKTLKLYGKYKGKYNNQSSAQESKSFLDFENKNLDNSYKEYNNGNRSVFNNFEDLFN